MADDTATPTKTRRRTRRSNAPTKADVEALLADTQKKLTGARKSASTARKKLTEATSGGAGDALMVMAEGAGAITGTVGASVVRGLVASFVEKDVDNWVSGGLIVTGVLGATIGAGLTYAGYRRTGSLASSMAVGWGAAGVADLAQEATEYLIEMGMDAMETPAPAPAPAPAANAA